VEIGWRPQLTAKDIHLLRSQRIEIYAKNRKLLIRNLGLPVLPSAAFSIWQKLFKALI
jgi:hypothetical protein